MASTVEELTGAAAIDPGVEDVVANSARNRGNAPPGDQTMVAGRRVPAVARRVRDYIFNPWVDCSRASQFFNGGCH